MNYCPYIVSAGARIRFDEKYAYRNVDQLLEEYRRWLRRASGGQVVWTAPSRFDLDEFPPPVP